MKLEVGKSYRNRYLQVVKIVRKSECPVTGEDHPYISSSNVSYTEEGMWCAGIKTRDDLVVEVPNKSTQDMLESDKQ